MRRTPCSSNSKSFPVDVRSSHSFHLLTPIKFSNHQNLRFIVETKIGMGVADELLLFSTCGEAATQVLQIAAHQHSPPMRKSMIKFTWLRRAVVAVIGFTVLLIGVAMVVLPGPAVVVIPLGLAILATEFVWAQRLLDKARATITRKSTKKNERSKAADDQIEPLVSNSPSEE